jgi:hypothetical protein
MAESKSGVEGAPEGLRVRLGHRFDHATLIPVYFAEGIGRRVGGMPLTAAATATNPNHKPLILLNGAPYGNDIPQQSPQFPDQVRH